MAKFMDENQDAERDDEGDKRNKKCVHTSACAKPLGRN
jgi:hypothetical protein